MFSVFGSNTGHLLIKFTMTGIQTDPFFQKSLGLSIIKTHQMCLDRNYPQTLVSGEFLDKPLSDFGEVNVIDIEE